MRVASLRPRLSAALVDAAVVVAGMAAVIGMGIAGAFVYNRIRGDQGHPCRDEDNGQDDDGEEQPDRVEEDVSDDVGCATRGSRKSQQLYGAVWGASAGLAVAGRNWRSPGFRLIGLRRVDAHTGGIVTVRSALIGALFDQAWQATWRRLFSSRAKRRQVRLSALVPQLRAVERKYRDDPEARSRAVKEFYQSNPVNPAGDCGWLVAGPLVSQLLLALSSRGGRTIRDRITGTGVIVER